ncbi:MAG: dihydropteroate synthase, partial [Prevotella sp.]|nr:dihydropteroate synthase [Prevotella sp.]
AAREFMEAGLVNIYGGCCGTTPEHIRALAAHLPSPPRGGEGVDSNEREKFTPSMILSGLEYLNIPALAPAVNTTISAASSPSNVTSLSPSGEMSAGQRGAAAGLFISIGERTNVAGSLKFKRLIKEGNYEEALTIARAQVDAGAQVIDVCMDDGMIDGVKAMTHFLNLIASEPEIAKVPVMIDSSKWEILEAGLQCVQGKSIVNSISLKEGEEKFLHKARHIHAMGAATVVMLFDEEGQADTYERKMTVARRAYSLLKSIGFPTEDIIFDPNVLSIATGMPEHDDYGRAFIAACKTIKEEMPEVHLSGGISNLSFSFRGNNTVRQAMHSVFLHHAMAVGLDMSIVNPAMTTNYDDIPSPLKETVEAVVLNTSHEASEQLITLAQQIKEEEEARKAAAAGAPVAEKKEESKPKELKERIAFAMLKGIDDNIEADALEAYQKEGTALAVIDKYLMPAMEEVGRLFGEGKMFLPQVVKSARVMKKAVGAVEPYMKDNTSAISDSSSSPIIMATVKGDVHDIGKNIVSVVLQCNGFEVKDLGVMVDPETIVDEAQKCNAAVIGLSGLITPSLTEMINVVKLLEKRGMTTPVIVGGATTSTLHTAVKMAPEYPHGIVIRAHAAADNPSIIRRLLAEDKEQYIAELKAAQRIVRDNYLRREADSSLLTIEESRKRRHVKAQEQVAVPRSTEQVVLASCRQTNSSNETGALPVSISLLRSRIDWPFFYQAWGLKGDARNGEEGEKLRRDAEKMLDEMEEKQLIQLGATARIVPAHSTDEDEIILSADGKDYTLPFPRSLKDEEETHCLADYVMRKYAARQLRQCPCCFSQHATDFVAPFVVTAGIGLKELQERYRKDNDEYSAIMAKLLCDRLAEALAEYVQEYLQKNLFWGICDEQGKPLGIRMAFGYGACPDHSLKIPVFDLLKAKSLLGISLTETNMITPGESICGLIFANEPVKYFNVN